MNGPAIKQKEFLDSQITSIFKALNVQETPVKEKHVRSIIIGSYVGLGSEVFWNVVMQNIPLQGNQIVCWKFCYILYKLLRDGHPNTLSISVKYKSRIKDLGKLWGHLKDGLSPLINNFCLLVSYKLDFHYKNPHFPNTLNVEQRELDRHFTNDDAYFDLSTELFDYLEYILKLQASIFTCLEQNNLNSLTFAGQCRVQPLIPCVQEAVLLYDHLVSIMLRLHINLEASLLDGHRQRFLQIFKVLKKFFEEALRLQYLKNLVAIPQLSENPPNFCKNMHHHNASRLRHASSHSTSSTSSPAPLCGTSLYSESQKIAASHPSIPKNDTDYSTLLDASHGKGVLLLPSPSESESLEHMLCDITNQHNPPPGLQHPSQAFITDALSQDLNFNFVQPPVQEMIMVAEKSTNTEIQSRCDFGIDTSDLCDAILTPKTTLNDEENVEKLKACLENSKVKYDALKQMYTNLRGTHFKLIQTLKPVKVDQELQTCGQSGNPSEQNGGSHCYERTHLPFTLLHIFAEEFYKNLPDTEILTCSTSLPYSSQTNTYPAHGDEATEGTNGVELNMNDLTSILAGIQGECDKFIQDSSHLNEINGTLEQTQRNQAVYETVKKCEKMLLKNGMPSAIDDLMRAGEIIGQYLSDQGSDQDNFNTYCTSLHNFFHGLSQIYNCLLVLVILAANNSKELNNKSNGLINGNNHFGDFEVVNLDLEDMPMTEGKNMTISDTIPRSFVTKFLSYLKNDIDLEPAPLDFQEEGKDFTDDSKLDVWKRWNVMLGQLKLASSHFLTKWTQMQSDNLDDGQHASNKARKLELEASNRMENLEQYLEKEISEVFDKINTSSIKLNEKLSVFVTMKNGLSKIEDKKLLDECNDLIQAVKILIEKAVILQKQLSCKSLQTSTDSANFYHKGNKWSQGFISIAKLVGVGVSMFVETVTKMQQREAKYEEIIIFAKEMTKNLAHLVWSAKIRTGTYSQQSTTDLFKELFKASRKIGDHTTKILDISRSINLTHFEENFEVNLTTLSLHQAKFLEIETQIKVLELESQIEKEQSKLLILRKKNYHLPDSL